MLMSAFSKNVYYHRYVEMDICSGSSSMKWILQANIHSLLAYKMFQYARCMQTGEDNC